MSKTKKYKSNKKSDDKFPIGVLFIIGTFILISLVFINHLNSSSASNSTTKELTSSIDINQLLEQDNQTNSTDSSSS